MRTWLLETKQNTVLKIHSSEDISFITPWKEVKKNIEDFPFESENAMVIPISGAENNTLKCFFPCIGLDGTLISCQIGLLNSSCQKLYMASKLWIFQSTKKETWRRNNNGGCRWRLGLSETRSGGSEWLDSLSRRLGFCNGCVWWHFFCFELWWFSCKECPKTLENVLRLMKNMRKIILSIMINYDLQAKLHNVYPELATVFMQFHSCKCASHRMLLMIIVLGILFCRVTVQDNGKVTLPWIILVILVKALSNQVLPKVYNATHALVRCESRRKCIDGYEEFVESHSCPINYVLSILFLICSHMFIRKKQVWKS